MCAMIRTNLDKRADHAGRDNGRVLSCPACAREPLRLIIILDSTHGDRSVRLFKCECGELVWDD